MNFSSPRRRFARAAVAGLALSGLLTACGGSGDSGDSQSSGPVTLPFWGWANGQDAVVKAFNASHKDIQLKYTKVTDQLTMQKQLTNAVKAGNAPCLVQNTAEYVTSWVAQGALADITEYVESSKDKFNSGAWANGQVQGKMYGVPTASAPAVHDLPHRHLQEVRHRGPDDLGRVRRRGQGAEEARHQDHQLRR